MLVDLLAAVRPALTVMDAVVGMEGNGPRNGRPKGIGAILAAADPVALDAVACRMVGIEPLMVPTTRIAHEQGVGVGDLARIELAGELLEAMLVGDFLLPSGPELYFRVPGLFRFLQSRLVAKPTLVEGRCTGCWTCVEHCPSEALSRTLTIRCSTTGSAYAATAARNCVPRMPSPCGGRSSRAGWRGRMIDPAELVPACQLGSGNGTVNPNQHTGHPILSLDRGVNALGETDKI